MMTDIDPKAKNLKMVMGRHRIHPPGVARQRITHESLQRSHDSTGTKDTKLSPGVSNTSVPSIKASNSC
jgi:hypothetical protein